MGDFHCPMGAAFYDDEGCILCEMCSAKTDEEMVAASARIRDYLRSQSVRTGSVKKIAVAGKGGVGKSTVTVLLTRALSSTGRNAIVLDTDESNAGLLNWLGLENGPRPLISLLPRLSSGEGSPDVEWLKRDSITTTSIPSEFTSCGPGIIFMMAGKIQDPFQGCACSMADLSRELVGKLSLAQDDIVLVDLEAGVESFGRGVERYMDTVLVVVEPSLESISLAERINYMAQGMGIRTVMAVINKVPSEEAARRVADELKKRNVNVAGAIFFDPAVSEASLEGVVPSDSCAAVQARTILDQVLGGTASESGADSL